MRQIWDFLIANPILFFVIAAWVAGAIGNAVRTRGQQRKRSEARVERQQQPSAARRVAPTQVRQQPPPVPRPTATGSRGPDEVAAEMRRILGLDPDEPQPTRAPEVMPRSEPVRRPPRSSVVEPERAPQPLAPEVAGRMLERHIDPHVGEGITGRKAAGSGRVGQHDRAWGSLGGRHRDAVAQVARPIERLVDLADLKRILVGAEVLGPPLALRPADQQRLF